MHVSEVWFCVVTVLLVYFRSAIGVIELVNEIGPQDREFRLTCRALSAHIAVLEASFAPRRPRNTTATLPGDNVRRAVNQRCSGRNHCSFILHADCPGSKLWGPGDLFIKYACMPEDRTTRFCNLDIFISPGGGASAQGFISSPGYPKFYVGQSSCAWRVRAPGAQRVELTLLDVSLSGSGISSVGGCEDAVQMRDLDSGVELLPRSCAELEHPLVVVSGGNSVEVVVQGREGEVVPKRGVLIYYRAVGCDTLTSPLDGYLVQRNATAAEYRCCVGYVFPDTGARALTLRCLINRWDRKLPSHCVNLQNLTQVPEVIDGQSTMTESSHLVDVIIPSVLIAGLLIGNAIVVFIIYQYKKRKNMDIQEEELNTMVAADSTNVP